MKKLLALLLAVVMIFCLMTACGKDEDDDDDDKGSTKSGVVGTWKATVSAADMGEDMEDLEGMEEYIDLDDVSMVVYLTFDKDGTYELTADRDSLEKMMKSLMQGMFDAMAKEFGMSTSDLLSSQGVSSIDELITDDDLDDLMDEMHETGEYTYEDGVLTIDGEEAELKGNTLTLEQDGVTIKFKRK